MYDFRCRFGTSKICCMKAVSTSRTRRFASGGTGSDLSSQDRSEGAAGGGRRTASRLYRREAARPQGASGCWMERKIGTCPRFFRKRIYNITARRMISGEVLKYRNGLCITKPYEIRRTRLNRFSSDNARNYGHVPVFRQVPFARIS